MLDCLVESRQPEADRLHSRAGFFILTAAIAISAVTASVIASMFLIELELGLDLDSLDKVTIAPIESKENTEQQSSGSPKSPKNLQNSSNQKPSSANIAPISPQFVPGEISNTKIQGSTINTERFNSGPVWGSTDGNDLYSDNSNTKDGKPSGSANAFEPEETNEKDFKPPQPPKTKPKILKTSDLLNSRAISLPKPIYPRFAQEMKIEGIVSVQVTIDESGNVISARAINGHPLLRKPSEEAAMKAKFTPTRLGGEPIKVTGLITYNYIRN